MGKDDGQLIMVAESVWELAGHSMIKNRMEINQYETFLYTFFLVVLNDDIRFEIFRFSNVRSKCPTKSFLQKTNLDAGQFP